MWRERIAMALIGLGLLGTLLVALLAGAVELGVIHAAQGSHYMLPVVLRASSNNEEQPAIAATAIAATAIANQDTGMTAIALQQATQAAWDNARAEAEATAAVIAAQQATARCYTVQIGAEPVYIERLYNGVDFVGGTITAREDDYGNIHYGLAPFAQGMAQMREPVLHMDETTRYVFDLAHPLNDEYATLATLTICPAP